jgi:hypothetical protein
MCRRMWFDEDLGLFCLESIKWRRKHEKLFLCNMIGECSFEMDQSERKNQIFKMGHFDW